MSRNCRKFIFLGGAGVLLGLLLSVQASSQKTTITVTATTPPVKIEYVPIKFVPPGDGARMYAQYCASCHGESGTGNGPAASALAGFPTDLTLLAFNNKGRFPDTHLNQMLSNRRAWADHEQAGMPFWYSGFRSLDMQLSSNADIRVNTLVSYIRKIQEPGLTISKK